MIRLVLLFTSPFRFFNTRGVGAFRNSRIPALLEAALSPQAFGAAARGLYGVCRYIQANFLGSSAPKAIVVKLGSTPPTVPRDV